ncbi:MAG: class I SAM-dependent DNA methyltransferase [Acidimicrobiales bacterium]
MSEPSYERATREAYDTVAVDYAELLRDELAASPFDRAVLSAFVDLVQQDGGGPVADLGCGPGRVTAHLLALGLPAFGVDLSHEMVAVARRSHPDLRFDQGSMAELDIEGDVLAGIVAWYSIIHTPPDHQPRLFGEFHRVLRPGGRLVVAFQVGDERVHLERAYGHELSLDAYRLPPDLVADELGTAGLTVTARLVREPTGSERQSQAYLFARKADDTSPGTG